MGKPNMAKGGKKAPGKHSREMRRAESPSINTDKSLKQVRLPQESADHRPAVLAAHHTGGVTKKSKSGRKAVLSTRARRRQEKSMDRAEAIMDRTAVKVQRSKGSLKVIQSRKKTWDEVNRDAAGKAELAKLSKKARAKMEEDEMVAAFYSDDGDEEMEGAEDDVAGALAEVVAAAPTQSAFMALATVDDGDEEIL